MDTIYAVVLFSLHALSFVKVLRVSLNQEETNLSQNHHVRSTSKPLKNKTIRRTGTNYFSKSVGKCRDLFMLRSAHEEKEISDSSPHWICNVIFTYKKIKNEKPFVGY